MRKLPLSGLRCLVCTVMAASVVWLLTPAVARAASFEFQPITVQRIDLPSSVQSAGWPVFAHDGAHVLFFSTGSGTLVGGTTGTGSSAALWEVGTDGSDPHCLTCGVANDPSSSGEGEIDPFPDGKRIFFGSTFQPGASNYAVLDCEPSVVNCQAASIEPVRFPGLTGSTILPGGAVSLPQVDSGGQYAAKLSQDGNAIGFSDIRTDSIETMMVAQLVQTSSDYVASDPRVINPPGPSSASDTNVSDWSNGGALYEFKTFTDGGADATYVEVGGSDLQNPDIWSVDLATGVRTRLTSNPDYDEDDAVSPNGQLLAQWSNRTMHMTDWLGGLLPVRDFIDAPGVLENLALSSSNKRCHGPMWIMPASGDDNAQILGQPIVDYSVPHVFVTNNLTGWPQWSPDGTMLALNTTNNTGSGYPAHAPFIYLAHFTSLKPSAPTPTVSSQPGSWGVTPSEYHPDFGYVGTRTLQGPGGGSVTLNYNETSVLDGSWSETYDNYSDNGRDFINGTASISDAVEYGTEKTTLAMTGADAGNDNVNLTFSPSGVSGGGESTYDGHTVTGPSTEQASEGACPDIQPKEPRMHLTKTRSRRGVYRLRVTVSISGAGLNEASVATAPVRHATVTIGKRTFYTNATGTLIVTPHLRERATVTAGNTLVPTATTLFTVHARSRH